MIDRYLLRYFLAVIDEGNFSRAAVRCHVSQPTLSVGIAKLEGILERPVFHRTNRRVELTEAGARLAVYARRIEADFLLAERDARAAVATQTLRLGVLVTFPSDWVAEALIDTGRNNSTERVEISEGRDRELQDRLARGRIDIALTLVRDISRLEKQRIFSERYCLAVSRHHQLAQRDVVAAEELIHEPMVLRRQCELLATTSRHFIERGVRPFFAARSSDDRRALSYVAAGFGVTVIPESLAAPNISTPRLADFPFTREIGLNFGPQVDVDETRGRWRLDAFVEALQSRAAEDRFAHKR